MAGQKSHSSEVKRPTQPAHRIRKQPRQMVRRRVGEEEVPALSVPQNEMGAIWVGKADGKEKFTFHKAVLCHYAPFFQDAFNSQPLNDDIQTVPFEDTTPEISGHLVNWVYTKSIRDPNTGDLPPLKQMVRLWVLGDKVSSQGVQNAAIRGLYETGWCGNNGDMKFIYSNTSTSSPIRKLFVDQIACHVPQRTLAGFLQKHLDECPPQMLADLVLAQQRLLENSDARKRAPVEEYLFVEIDDQ